MLTSCVRAYRLFVDFRSRSAFESSLEISANSLTIQQLQILLDLIHFVFTDKKVNVIKKTKKKLQHLNVSLDNLLPLAFIRTWI